MHMGGEGRRGEGGGRDQSVSVKFCLLSSPYFTRSGTHHVQRSALKQPTCSSATQAMATPMRISLALEAEAAEKRDRRGERVIGARTRRAGKKLSETMNVT